MAPCLAPCSGISMTLPLMSSWRMPLSGRQKNSSAVSSFSVVVIAGAPSSAGPRLHCSGCRALLRAGRIEAEAAQGLAEGGQPGLRRVVEHVDPLPALELVGHFVGELGGGEDERDVGAVVLPGELDLLPHVA